MRWKDISAKYPELEFNGDLDFWFIPGIEGLGFDIARPRRPDENPLNLRYMPEIYEVKEIDNAFVQSIYVLDDNDIEEPKSEE